MHLKSDLCTTSLLAISTLHAISQKSTTNKFNCCLLRRWHNYQEAFNLSVCEWHCLDITNKAICSYTIYHTGKLYLSSHQRHVNYLSGICLFIQCLHLFTAWSLFDRKRYTSSVMIHHHDNLKMSLQVVCASWIEFIQQGHYI